jgi:hypothetical protein
VLERLDDPVAEAWRESAWYNAHAWVSQNCETAGCGKTIVYQRGAEWLKKYDVDIPIPYAFYRDLRVCARLVAHDAARSRCPAERARSA